MVHLVVYFDLIDCLAARQFMLFACEYLTFDSIAFPFACPATFLYNTPTLLIDVFLTLTFLP